MVKFKMGQSVCVIGPVEHPCLGETGKVVRLLFRSRHEAWVEMDRDLPPDLASFPADDPRRNYFLLLDHECEEKR